MKNRGYIELLVRVGLKGRDSLKRRREMASEFKSRVGYFSEHHGFDIQSVTPMIPVDVANAQLARQRAKAPKPRGLYKRLARERRHARKGS